jgi:hypothetical protein
LWLLKKSSHDQTVVIKKNSDYLICINVERNTKNQNVQQWAVSEKALIKHEETQKNMATRSQGFPMNSIWATKGIAEKAFVPRVIIPANTNHFIM